MIKYFITTYPFLLLFTIIQGVNCEKDCTAYGMRLALGHYFTHLQNELDVMRISFNTQNNCSSRFYITVTNANGFSRATNTFTTDLLNITEIYENTPTKYKYETYVNTFKLGIHDLDLMKTFQNYTYVLVQDQKIEQGPYFFNIPQKHYTKQQKYVVFGDMDSNWIKNTSKPTFDWFSQQITQKSDFEALLFMGDMAYNLETKDYQYAEDWLRNISLFTQHYPFMITPGNHDSEQNHNFEFIRAVFQTLDLRQYDDVDFYNDFYSFDIGNAHFIQFNPVKLAYQEELEHTRENMLNIFRRDLELAQLNRQNVPWIIVYTHYPLYCSGAQDVFCGRNFQSFKEFEYLFKEFHVDLYLAGHQHSYERDKPFFQNKSTDYDQQGDVITNYQVPIHIIEGTAGNDYSMPSKIYAIQPYTEIQAIGCGVGILTIWNQTHLQFEHRYTINNSIADTIWLKKTIENTEDSDISVISIFFYCLGVIIILLTIFVVLLIIRRRKQKMSAFPTFVETVKD